MNIRKILLLICLCFCLALPGIPGAFAADKGSLSKREYSGAPFETNLNYTSPENMVANMNLIAEYSGLSLFVNYETLHFALVNSADGSIYLSNPYNGSADSYYSGNIKSDLDSIVSLEYLNIEENKKYEMWSSADCVAFGQYNTVPMKNGIKFEMALGEIKTAPLVPEVLTESRFEEYQGLVSDWDASKMEMFYQHYSLDDLSESEQKEFAVDYPLIKTTDIYILGNLNDRELRDLEKILEEAGYTAEDYEADAKSAGTKAAVQSSPCFTLDLELTLTKQGLSINIPAGSISYDHSLYTLLSLNTASYFGADLPDESGDGYLFIPDGSGAIIDFDETNENRRRVISGTVYGRNFTLEQTKEGREGEAYFLPVYGIRRNNGSAFAAVITGGDETAEIVARLGSPNTRYFTVFAHFIVTPSEYLIFDTKATSHNSEFSAYITGTAYTGDYTVLYTPLSGEDANYSGMARLYRNYLRASGMEKNDDANELFLNLSVLGSSYSDSTFLGFQMERQAAYTTYSQTSEIGNYFINNGADLLRLTLLGWQKRGLNAGFGNQGKASSLLGGKSGIKKLAAWAGDNNVSLFAAGDFQFVGYDYLFDGFIKTRDADRQINQEYAGLRAYQPDISKFGRIRYAVKTKKYASAAVRLQKRLSKLGFENVFLSETGTHLPGTNRTAAKEEIIKLLKNTFSDENIAFSGANAYILPYAGALTDIPLTHSFFAGETAPVPFLQMVLSGSASYSSVFVNLNEDWETQLLRCAESRTSPSFVLAFENIQALKRSDFTEYYAVSFELLKEDVISAYTALRERLLSTEGSAITGHQYINENVTCTLYENNVRVFVNYGDTDYSGDGFTIPAKDYAVVEK